MKDNKFWVKSAAAVSALGLTGLFLRSEYEKDHFVIESLGISSPKIRHRHRFLYLTDIHDKEFGRENEKLTKALLEIYPEAVFIGGDTMVAKPGRADLAVTERLLDLLSGIAPVYYANGNHEQRLRDEAGSYPGVYEAFCHLLEKYKVVYLSDSSALIDDDVSVSGFDLDNIYYRPFSAPDLSVSEITERIGGPDTERYQILLAHSPLFFDAYAGWGADLTLAGHFHGGTVRIPKLGGLMTPQFQFFSPYCAGTFRKGDKVMLVGRGLGTHSVNIRLNDMPQVCVLEITPSN